MYKSLKKFNVSAVKSILFFVRHATSIRSLNMYRGNYNEHITDVYELLIAYESDSTHKGMVNRDCYEYSKTIKNGDE